ncbi:sulfotransferase domain-containing protein [Salsipaludibacter albus]|uniref:sulfotransferase domain-containing protein n=1 Tax=Salsipaludibacter albus TaxID=2849650 RepID=UPI001EE41086|nr:sulfotransferase domain-containing protein [Salsipaludibacter albus]
MTASPLVSTPGLGRLPSDVRRSLRLPVVWWRHRHVERDDVYLAHYPKSGSTWLRFLLVTLARPDAQPDFAVVRDLLPPVTNPGRGLVLPDGGRFVHSHELPGPRIVRTRRVLYLVRDPRDVCVSYFFHARRDGWSGGFDRFLRLFLAGEVGNWGSWAAHARSGLALGDDRDLVVLRYEDLLADTRTTLARVAAWLGLPSDHEQLAPAVEASSRRRMRAKEHTIVTGGDGPGSFVRGRDDDRWPDLATTAQSEAMADTFGRVAARVGYDLGAEGR